MDGCGDKASDTEQMAKASWKSEERKVSIGTNRAAAET
jgi:hypothetical protein